MGGGERGRVGEQEQQRARHCARCGPIISSKIKAPRERNLPLYPFSACCVCAVLEMREIWWRKSRLVIATLEAREWWLSFECSVKALAGPRYAGSLGLVLKIDRATTTTTRTNKGPIN